jgi:transcriptional regulator with XRE-family HTH domain
MIFGLMEEVTNGSGRSRKAVTASEEKLLREVAKRIRKYRKENYSSIEAFANESGISRSQVARYEAPHQEDAKIIDVQLLSLCRILKSLNVPLKDFFSEGFSDY